MGVWYDAVSGYDIRLPMSDRELLIWIDLEMTGLRPEVDHIIEMAALVTDRDLAVVVEAPVIAIHQSEAILGLMDEWNRTQHGGSGLLQRVRASRISEAEAEQTMLQFLSSHVAPGSSPMCGNSICQDRRFLARHMPSLERFFHYRNLDVSTVKELARRWAPSIADGPQKKGSHLALDDIRESVAELRYYRQHLFAPQFRLHADA